MFGRQLTAALMNRFSNYKTVVPDYVASFWIADLKHFC